MGAGERSPFSQRLRQLRKEAGLTQEELAERAGLSVKAISALERGNRQHPYPNTIRAIADALGLDEAGRAGLASAAPERQRPRNRPSPAQPTIPAPPTALIGRDHDLAGVCALLRSGATRLVTLSGPGGVGKTRLAIEVALDYGTTGGQVAFVGLAALSDPDLVLPTIAQSVGLTQPGNAPLTEQLARHFLGERWLLVLDNMEHLLPAASEIAELLAACPDLLVLATSRAPLRIRAEHEYPVRPLAVPDMSQTPALDDVAGASAVQLFLDRARAVVPSFDLTEANYTAVAAICRRLDGLPLALELVAARIRVLDPAGLLARLNQLLPMLTGGSRDLPQRQQTMQAAIAWSYELLDDATRTLFRRLSVFAGGWTLDAAERVTAWDPCPVESVMDLLTGLVDQSLVVAETHEHGQTRFRMLEPVRQFAAGLVQQAGEHEQLASRHLEWCVELVRVAEVGLRGPGQEHWLARLELDHDNLRAGLTFGQQQPELKALEVELATRLWLFWETRGYLTEGRRWLEHALTGCEDVPINMRAYAFNAAGNLARDQGDHEDAVRLHTASLDLYQEADDAVGMAQVLNNLGNIMLDQGNYSRATTLYAEALLYFRELNMEWDVANTLCNVGIAFGCRGDYDQAIRLLEEALDLRRKQGEPASVARSMDALAEVRRKRGDIEQAMLLHQESLTIRRKLGDVRGLSTGLTNLGIAEGYRGNLAEAERLINESLEIRRSVGNTYGASLSLGALARIQRLRGDAAGALAMYREALHVQQRSDITESVADILRGVAAIAVDHGAPGAAARLLGAINALSAAGGLAIALADRDELHSIREAAGRALTVEEFSSEWAAGSALTLEQAIADAMTVQVVIT